MGQGINVTKLFIHVRAPTLLTNIRLGWRCPLETEHPSLFPSFVNYGHKSFITLVPRHVLPFRSKHGRQGEHDGHGHRQTLGYLQQKSQFGLAVIS
jgi:hypothetical protein